MERASKDNNNKYVYTRQNRLKVKNSIKIFYIMMKKFSKKLLKLYIYIYTYNKSTKYRKEILTDMTGDRKDKIL